LTTKHWEVFVMSRRGLGTWLSAGAVALGLSVVSFAGCGTFYGDHSEGTGVCEDDDNPCTNDKCTKGPSGTTTVHEPVPDEPEKACSRGDNSGVCKAGKCKLDCESDPASCKCVSEAECPMSDACAKWACASGQCTRTISTDGTLVDTLEERDCKKTVCISGTPQTAEDALDIPEDVADDCKMPACDGMTPSTTPDDTDPPPDNAAGDCQAFICQNGNPIMGPDDSDKPADNECVVNTCVGGVVMPANANTGKPCATGACDSKGKCADCMSEADWTQCGGIGCPVKLCNGEACVVDDSRCKSGACDDGVCCDVACNDVCRSCNLNGSKGVCTNIPYYQEDMYYGAAMTCDYTIAGSACDGNGKCLKIVGVTCTQGPQCLSGVCTNLKCLGATGEGCSGNAECVSNMCAMGTCK
jgi:hypothetical protein